MLLRARPLEDPAAGPRGQGSSQAREERGETELQRLDRNLAELLQELRVAGIGVQILVAFLLTLPFTQRFGKVTGFERGVYAAVLGLSSLASALFIAPVAYHRMVFRMHEKRRLVQTANRMAITGLAALALAMTGVILLITHVLFGATAAAVAAAVTGTAFAWLWFALPLRRRATTGDPDGP